jgi:hypothetical protein
MRNLKILIVSIVLLVVGAVGASAVTFGVRAGYYFDAEAVAVGTELLTPMDDNGRWYFNPNVELAMGDIRDMVALSADFHYDFQPSARTAVWAGAGPAMFIIDRGPFGDDDTDLGANFLVGMGANSGNVRPYAQFRATVKDNTEATVAVGLRF